MCLSMAQEVRCQHGGIIFSVSDPCYSTLRMLHKVSNFSDIYTAATVLIAGRLCSPILSEVTEASITHSWECALDILRKYQKYSTSARRCVAALEILYEQVVSEGQPLTDHVATQDFTVHVPGTLNDVSFGEGVNATMMEGFELLDFQDMSWLNSVPSNLI